MKSVRWKAGCSITAEPFPKSPLIIPTNFSRHQSHLDPPNYCTHNRERSQDLGSLWTAKAEVACSYLAS